MARKKKREDPEQLAAELLERHAALGPDDLERAAEEDRARAEAALKDGRLVEATLAAAWGLWLQPARGDLLDLLDQALLEGTRRGVELPPPGVAPEALFKAILAHAAWLDGDRGWALELLDESSVEDPDLPFAGAWLPRWLDDDAALAALGEEAVVRLAALAALAAEEEPRLLAVAERAERVLGLDRVGDPATRDLLLHALAAAGRHDEAVALARDAVARQGEVDARRALASTLVRAGRDDEAVEACLAVHAAAPDDVDSLVDAADLRLEQERWGDALALYERALARHTDHPWAGPSAHYCRWRLGDAAALEALRACATAPDDEEDEEDEGLLGSLMGRLMGRPPEAAASELMSMLSGPPPGQARERARQLLRQAEPVDPDA
jgi:tetratricopeptide (TPR) repeat protein